MTCSSGTKRSPSGSATKRGSSGGTFTRAKRSLAGRRVAHDDGEVQRQVGDVRERVRGVDGERREHREDAVVEHRRRGTRGRRRRGRPSRRTRMPASSSAGTISLVNTAAWRGDQLVDPRADRAELLDQVEAVGRRWCAARPSSCSFEPDDAHLEELVEVLAEDGEELGPLEQRDSGRPRPSASTRALKSSHDSSRFRKRSDASENGGCPCTGCAGCAEAFSSPTTGQCYSRNCWSRPWRCRAGCRVSSGEGHEH